MKSIGTHVAVLETSVRTRLLISLFFTCVTAVCAQVSFRLWYTPVPVTLQVLGVILSGLALGSRWGAISQIQYLALGAMGLPVFAGWSGSPAAFIGPSGGYLVGFVPGAFAAGWVFEKLERRTGLAPWAGGIAGIVGVYLLGAAWLAVWLAAVNGRAIGVCIWDACRLGILPFIGIDLLKALAASSLARAHSKWAGGAKG